MGAIAGRRSRAAGQRRAALLLAGADPTPAATSAWFEAIDDDVMIETEHELEDGSRRQIHSLYMFSASRLVRAIAVPAVAVGEPHA